MRKSVLLICMVLTAFPHLLMSCGSTTVPAYAATISYKVNTSSPLSVKALAVFDFDVAELVADDSIIADWGDGTTGYMYADEIGPDSLANRGLGYTKYCRHKYSATHSYSGPGTYGISVLGQYRTTYASNIAITGNPFNPFFVQTVVVVDTIPGYDNYPPVFAPPTISYTGLDTAFSLVTMVSDPDADADSVGFSLVVPLQDSANHIEGYTFPDQFCRQAGDSGSYMIDPMSGLITWTHPCETGVYSFAVVISKFRHGRFIGSSMTDQLIYVEANNQLQTGVQEIASPFSLQLFTNPATDRLSGKINGTSQRSFFAQVLSADGVVVYGAPIQSSGFDISLAALSTGIYLLHVESPDGSLTTKFAKE